MFKTYIFALYSFTHESDSKWLFSVKNTLDLKMTLVHTNAHLHFIVGILLLLFLFVFTSDLFRQGFNAIFHIIWKSRSLNRSLWFWLCSIKWVIIIFGSTRIAADVRYTIFCSPSIGIFLIQRFVIFWIEWFFFIPLEGWDWRTILVILFDLHISTEEGVIQAAWEWVAERRTIVISRILKTFILLWFLGLFFLRIGCERKMSCL